MLVGRGRSSAFADDNNISPSGHREDQRWQAQILTSENSSDLPIIIYAVGSSVTGIRNLRQHFTL